MAEDFHDKTEEPTAKRLADARKKGLISKSQDLVVSLLLMLSLVLLFFFSGYMYFRLQAIVLNLFTNLNFDFDGPGVVIAMFRSGLIKVFWVVFPPIAGIAALAVLLNALQTQGLVSFYPIKPQWSRINPFLPSNYERNFSSRALVRIGFGLIRINMVVILSVFIMGIDAFRIFNIGKGNAKDILLYVHKQAALVAIGIAVSYVFVGILDFLYQKWRYMRELRMSRREIKEETKQLEGDVHVKARIRTTMRSYANSNISHLVSYADALIVDGYGIAVAIGYKPDLAKVPIVLCKGAKKRAFGLITRAKKHGIPIFENPLLAKALFYRVIEEEHVQPELYHEIAKILMKQAPKLSRTAAIPVKKIVRNSGWSDRV